MSCAKVCFLVSPAGPALDCRGHWHGTPSVCPQGGHSGAPVQAVSHGSHVAAVSARPCTTTLLDCECAAGCLGKARTQTMTSQPCFCGSFLAQQVTHVHVPLQTSLWFLCCREECGVDVILFSSCEEPPVPHSSTGSKRQRATAAASAGSSFAGRTSTAGNAHSTDKGIRKQKVPVGPVAGAAAVAAAGVSAGVAGSWLSCLLLLLVAAAALLCWSRLSGSSSRFQGLWYKPVRAYVQGGYTISPREDCNAINSPECLVTCILKVGVCRQGSSANQILLLCC